MERVVQIRNVPDTLHRALKAKAATAGMSLSNYLLAELQEIADHPTLAEFRLRLHSCTRMTIAVDNGKLIREERDTR